MDGPRAASTELLAGHRGDDVQLMLLLYAQGCGRVVHRDSRHVLRPPAPTLLQATRSAVAVACVLCGGTSPGLGRSPLCAPVPDPRGRPQCAPVLGPGGGLEELVLHLLLRFMLLHGCCRLARRLHECVLDAAQRCSEARSEGSSSSCSLLLSCDRLLGDFVVISCCIYTRPPVSLFRRRLGGLENPQDAHVAPW